MAMLNNQIAIQNGPVETVSFPIQNGGSIVSYIRLLEGHFVDTSTLADMVLKIFFPTKIGSIFKIQLRI